MGTLILFGLLVGLDNLQITAGLGTLAMRPARRWILVAAFALCEAVMPLIGLFGGHLLREELDSVGGVIGPLFLLGCGLLILLAARRKQDTAALANSRWVLLSLPLALSLDNLLAGLGLGALGYPVLLSALLVGLISGAMCFVGLFLGHWVRPLLNRWVPVQIEWISGTYLVLIALITLFFDV